MSKYEQKELEGALFINKEKVEQTDKVNAKGSALIDGVEYWVKAWTNTSKAGEKYQKLSFTPEETAGRARAKLSRLPSKSAARRRHPLLVMLSEWADLIIGVLIILALFVLVEFGQ